MALAPEQVAAMETAANWAKTSTDPANSGTVDNMPFAYIFAILAVFDAYTAAGGILAADHGATYRTAFAARVETARTRATAARDRRDAQNLPAPTHIPSQSPDDVLAVVTELRRIEALP